MSPRPTASARTLIVVALAAFSGACGGSRSGAPALISVDPIAAGEACTNGGVTLRTGVDDDGDGILADEEVDATEVVCNGASGTAGESSAGTALRTIALPRGDADCPDGGVRIEAGRDDGAGGGTAGDGVLQDGEVDDSALVCAGAPGFDVGSLHPPAGPPGAFTIDASGGHGGDACGGDGGAITFGPVEEPGLPGGHVKVFQSGVADASFTLPVATIVLGDVPFEVTEDTTVPSLADADCDGVPDDTGTLGAGDVYGISCDDTYDSSLYSWDGADGEVVTGVHVAAGVTLTLPAKPPLLVARPADGVRMFEFDRDVFNEGTITIDTGEVYAPGIYLRARVFDGGSGSTIVVHGEQSRITLEAGVVVNAGVIDVDGPEGLGGGTVEVYSDSTLWNTGDIHASGAPVTDGEVGAAGGSVYFRAYDGLRNSGAITARGASVGSNPGRGGSVQFEAWRGGLVNAGDVIVDGSTPPPACIGCAGGSASDEAIAFNAYGGGIVSSGDISARGGDGNATGGGGDGGTIYILASDSEGIPSRAVTVSGNLLTTGGNGGDDGGDGGTIHVARTTYSSEPGEVVLLGYTGVRLDGGDSTGACGGDGGGAVLSNDCPDDVESIVGGAAFATSLSAHGGDGATGGEAGGLSLYVCSDPAGGRFVGVNVALIDGDLDLSGGSGTSGYGAAGGQLVASAVERIEQHGRIDVSGGDGAEGAEGGLVYFDVGSVGRASSTGSIDGSGGDGNGSTIAAGGSGGLMLVYGGTVVNSADLSLAGGDGADLGGDGGEGTLISLLGQTVNTGAVDVSGGAGAEAGEPGSFSIDGIEVVTP